MVRIDKKIESRNHLNIKDFKVNLDAYDAIEKEICHRNSGIPQPIMIIGVEGSGKTPLLARIYNAHKELKTLWIEGRYVFSSDDVIKKAEEVKCDTFFIDNMDIYFSKCKYEEQYRLRRYLNSEESPMLIASANKMIPSFTEYQAPFFEGLKIVNISPVQESDLQNLFTGKKLKRALSLYKLIGHTIKSIIIMHTLIMNNTQGREDVESLLFYFSDKYKMLYSKLPIYSQKILNSFAYDKEELTLSEIRAKTGLGTNILTVYLRSLKDTGVITIDKSIKKQSKYILKDRLFRIWLEKSKPSVNV